MAETRQVYTVLIDTWLVHSRYWLIVFLQKMCIMPEGTELLMEDGKEYPLLRCRNVYMLPGKHMSFALLQILWPA
jgi:hypothetical protein